MNKKPNYTRLFFKVFLWLLLLPVHVVAGVIWLVFQFGKLFANMQRLHLATRKTINCRAGHSNPTTGFFECGKCSGRYQGSVWSCPLCGSLTRHFNCCHCGLSIESGFNNE